MVEAAAEDAKVDCEEGVMVLDLGDKSGLLLLACCDPDCKGGKGEVEEAE